MTELERMLVRAAEQVDLDEELKGTPEALRLSELDFKPFKDAFLPNHGFGGPILKVFAMRVVPNKVVPPDICVVTDKDNRVLKIFKWK